MADRIEASDGSSWPRPSLESDDSYGVGHRLRHGNLQPGDLMEAASIIDAYGYLLIEANRTKRDLVARDIRSAVRQSIIAGAASPEPQEGTK